MRPDAFPPEVQAVLDAGPIPQAASMVSVDPPEHSRLRASVHKAFTLRRVASLEAGIHALAHRLIDRFVAAGRVDLLAEFTLPLSLLVMCQLIGMPEADAEEVKFWCDAFTELSGVPMPVEQQVIRAEHVVAGQRYILNLIEQQRRRPSDTLTSDLVQAMDAGEVALSQAEAVDLLMLQLVAGNETTGNMLSIYLYQLLREPQHWQTLCADPSVIPNMIEEAMRLDGPGFGYFRRATEPVTLHGVMIPAGALVWAMFSSANHDEQHFCNPNQFDPHRPNASRHLSFGHGTHYCLGASLARLEMKIALEALCERLPGLSLDPDQPINFKTSFVRILDRLPVIWQAASGQHS